MKKKPTPKIQVRVFGEYVNKKGQKRKGFVKYDGRKKQTIYISDKKSGKSFKLTDKIGVKKKFKSFKQKIAMYIKREFGSYKGIKIRSHTPKLRIKKVEFIVSKPMVKSYDKDHKRVETIEFVETIPAAKNVFFAAFEYARKTNALIVIPVIRIELTFTRRKNYTYNADWFIYARRNDANLNLKMIMEVWNEIQLSLRDKISEIKSMSYDTKTLKIKFLITWIYKNNVKTNNNKR